MSGIKMGKLWFRLVLLWARLNGRQYRKVYGRVQVRHWGGKWMDLEEHVKKDHSEGGRNSGAN